MAFGVGASQMPPLSGYDWALGQEAGLQLWTEGKKLLRK